MKAARLSSLAASRRRLLLAALMLAARRVRLPLVTLQFITTIAKVTFYGKDHAGNEVAAVGQIGITFGNFGDPE